MGKKIVILYYSSKGNTKFLAKRIFNIFREFVPLNLKIELISTKKIDIEYLKTFDGFIIGSPDYFGYISGYIKIFFDEIYNYREELKEKPGFAFISHGGGGKAAKKLKELCESVNLNFISPVISVKEKNISSKDEKNIQKHCREMLDLLNL